MLESLRARGIEIPEAGGEKKPKMGTRVRPKKNQAQLQSQQSTEEDVKSNEGETKPVEEDLKIETTPKENEDLKESWDQESGDESKESPDPSPPPENGSSNDTKAQEESTKVPTVDGDSADRSSDTNESNNSSRCESEEESCSSEPEVEHKTDAEKKRDKAEHRIEVWLQNLGLFPFPIQWHDFV